MSLLMGGTIGEFIPRINSFKGDILSKLGGNY